MSRLEFLVNNRDRDSSEDALEFTIPLPFIPDVQSASYTASVNCCTIENALPIVQANVNDQLWFSYNGGASSNLIFEEGNYDIYDFINILQPTLTALNPAFLVQFDTKQYKLQLFVPAGVTFTLLRTHPRPLDLVDFSSSDRTDRLLELLGWSFGGSDSFTLVGGGAGYTWIPDNIVRVRATAYLHLNCNYNVGNVFTSSKTDTRHPLIRIPMLHPYGTLDHYQKIEPSGFVIDNANGLRLTFFVTDEWGDQRRMGPNKNMFFSFQLVLITTE